MGLVIKCRRLVCRVGVPILAILAILVILKLRIVCAKSKLFIIVLSVLP